MSLLVTDGIETLEQLSRIRIQEFEAEMELTDGPCVGRYIVISNESDRDIDAEAVFRFYDKEGAYIDDNTSHAYGISAGGRGIVFGQIDNKNLDHITSHISFSESIYRPIDQCVSMKVKDKGEEGISVTARNTSDSDIDEFRIRVLWLHEDQLET